MMNQMVVAVVIGGDIVVGVGSVVVVDGGGEREWMMMDLGMRWGRMGGGFSCQGLIVMCLFKKSREAQRMRVQILHGCSTGQGKRT